SSRLIGLRNGRHALLARLVHASQYARHDVPACRDFCWLLAGLLPSCAAFGSESKWTLFSTQESRHFASAARHRVPFWWGSSEEQQPLHEPENHFWQTSHSTVCLTRQRLSASR